MAFFSLSARMTSSTRSASRPAAPPSDMVSSTGGGRRAVVVGREPDVPRALEHPVIEQLGGLELASVFLVPDEDANFSAQGAALDELLRRTAASTLFIAGPLGPNTMRLVTDVALLHGCGVIAVMPSEVLAIHDPRVVWEGERPLIQLLASRRGSTQRVVKRLLDVATAAALLVALAPVLLLVAALVRLDSPGPVLFRHQRMGRSGRAFSCLKFRTMVADAERRLAADPELHALYRTNNFRIPDAIDPRVTRTGRLLRRLSIDELPQLLNVLVGEMSLVGPRPVIAEELVHFAGSERLLLSVPPGMTGLWAVSGRHSCAYPARAELELSYVRSWSLRSDLRIMALTARAVASYGSAGPS